MLVQRPYLFSRAGISIFLPARQSPVGRIQSQGVNFGQGRVFRALFPHPPGQIPHLLFCARSPFHAAAFQGPYRPPGPCSRCLGRGVRTPFGPVPAPASWRRCRKLCPSLAASLLSWLAASLVALLAASLISSLAASLGSISSAPSSAKPLPSTALPWPS